MKLYASIVSDNVHLVLSVLLQVLQDTGNCTYRKLVENRQIIIQGVCFSTVFLVYELIMYEVLDSIRYVNPFYFCKLLARTRYVIPFDGV